MGAPVVGFPDHPVAAHQIAVAAVGEGHIQRVGLGVEILGLPGTRGGRRDVGGDAAAEADPQHKHQQKLADRVQQAFHRWASAQGIKGQEKGEAEGKAAEDQNILLPRRHPVHPKAVIEILVESTGLGTWTDVAEGGHLAATDGAAKSERVEILEGCAGFNPNLLDPFVGVVDVAAAATFKTVGPWIAL